MDRRGGVLAKQANQTTEQLEPDGEGHLPDFDTNDVRRGLKTDEIFTRIVTLAHEQARKHGVTLTSRSSKDILH